MAANTQLNFAVSFSQHFTMFAKHNQKHQIKRLILYIFILLCANKFAIAYAVAMMESFVNEFDRNLVACGMIGKFHLSNNNNNNHKKPYVLMVAIKLTERRTNGETIPSISISEHKQTQQYPLEVGQYDSSLHLLS